MDTNASTVVLDSMYSSTVSNLIAFLVNTVVYFELLKYDS